MYVIGIIEQLYFGECSLEMLYKECSFPHQPPYSDWTPISSWSFACSVILGEKFHCRSDHEYPHYTLGLQIVRGIERILYK